MAADFRALQRRLGVTADGILGRQSYGALFRKLGAPPEHAAGFALAASVWLKHYGISDSPLRLAHFLAQVGHESAGFKTLRENLFYTTAARIAAVWPSRFPTEAVARSYTRSPERLANLVYAGRLGNGPLTSGDGYRYIGRGLIQLTGRANYRDSAQRIGIDFEARPELVEMPSVALLTAAEWWARHGLNALADADNVTAVTRRINGGTTGLADRQARLKQAKELMA